VAVPLHSVRGVYGGCGAQQKGKQQKGKGGGGPSNKAAGSSSGEASTSRGECSRPSTLPSASAGLHATVEGAVQPALPSAEAASSAAQQPAGGGKKEKQRQRKERQKQRRMEEAWEALQVAIEAMLDERCVSPLVLVAMCIGRYPPFPWEVAVSSCSWQGALTCGGVRGCSGESALNAVEKATAEAAKHGDRSSEQLAALVAEARVMIEQAKAEQAERATAAAEEATAAAAVKAATQTGGAAERLQMEEQAAALTLQLQQVQARLGVPPAAPDAEETMCVVCFDAPKDHIIVPCYHLCVCEACANLLTQMDKPTCPICRAAIQQTNKVFQT
jgi:hypothetical protein